MKPIAIGIHDFKTIIETGSLFIDKTLLIKELIDNTSAVICLPRPRRFGKTLNMSMLYYYFSRDYKDNNLFDGLKIMSQGEKYLMEMNKYPVISLSLKNTKFDNYEGFIDNYKDVMKALYGKYEYLLKSDKLDETEKNDFLKITRKEEDILLPNALSKLASYLSKHYESQVIVLLDEYDAPIINGYLKGYYDEIITFIKQIFVTTFKDNNDLKKGVITGISRISKENLFSDANNINVYNITDSRFSTHFGFTEDEVKWALKEYGLEDNFKDVKKWYDGYLFDENIIYNPWSILKYLENPRHTLTPYWVKTGGIDLLRNLIYKFDSNTVLLEEFNRLLEKGLVKHVELDLNMDLKYLRARIDNIWTLFLLCGYLTPTKLIDNPSDVNLRIPNLEVKQNLEDISRDWLNPDEFGNNQFIYYLRDRNLDKFKEDLEKIVLKGFSYYDIPNNSNGENFYHAFMMGILYSGCKFYDITSNRESGFGRYDLLLKPKTKDIPAYIIEFKLVRDNDFSKVIEDAFKQIDEKNYIESIKDYQVIKMVIAFKGKKIRIETR